jgi:hypothetical protein
MVCLARPTLEDFQNYSWVSLVSRINENTLWQEGGNVGMNAAEENPPSRRKVHTFEMYTAPPIRKIPKTVEAYGLLKSMSSHPQ